MPTFVAFINEDLNHELQFVIKEVKKVTKKYTKTQCIEDLVKIAVKDKRLTINKILNLKDTKEK